MSENDLKPEYFDAMENLLSQTADGQEGRDIVKEIFRRARDWRPTAPPTVGLEVLREIAGLSDKPDDHKWYDTYGDPEGADSSNSGDMDSFGFKRGLHYAAKIARAALSTTPERDK